MDGGGKPADCNGLELIQFGSMRQNRFSGTGKAAPHKTAPQALWGEEEPRNERALTVEKAEKQRDRHSPEGRQSASPNDCPRGPAHRPA